MSMRAGVAAAASARSRELTNLLTDTPDEAALAIACFLATAKDLLRLQLACKRFSTKSIVAPLGLGAAGPSTALVQRLCIAAEAARRWVAGCSEQERGWVPRRALESWLSLMHEVGLLRLPLGFGRAHHTVTLYGNGVLATLKVAGTERIGEPYWRSAASKVVMRSGRYLAQFTVVAGGPMFGVLRPGWDVEGGGDADEVDGHCFYYTQSGACHPRHKRTNGDGMGRARKWEGMQAADHGDRVGMLLDLDKGSMTVWKNGERLGVMAEGLTGPFCWAASLDHDDTLRIESVSVFASPTIEELAQTEADRQRFFSDWQHDWQHAFQNLNDSDSSDGDSEHEDEYESSTDSQDGDSDDSTDRDNNDYGRGDSDRADSDDSDSQDGDSGHGDEDAMQTLV